MRLHYLVKLKIHVFVKILMLEKRNSKIWHIDYDFTCLLYTSDAADE